jgi:hypothetical protein
MEFHKFVPKVLVILTILYESRFTLWLWGGRSDFIALFVVYSLWIGAGFISVDSTT